MQNKNVFVMDITFQAATAHIIIINTVWEHHINLEHT